MGTNIKLCFAIIHIIDYHPTFSCITQPTILFHTSGTDSNSDGGTDLGGFSVLALTWAVLLSVVHKQNYWTKVVGKSGFPALWLLAEISFFANIITLTLQGSGWVLSKYIVQFLTKGISELFKIVKFI